MKISRVALGAWRPWVIFRGTLILDDYGHHPTEIKSTIDAVRSRYGDKKINHGFFTPIPSLAPKRCLKILLSVFQKTDELIVLDIFGSAREKQGGVHTKDLIKQIETKNHENKIEQVVSYIPGLREAESYLRENLQGDEILLLIGAGDVFRIGENLLKQ